MPRTGGLKFSAVYSARSGTPFSLVDTHARCGPQRPHDQRVPAGRHLHRRRRRTRSRVDYKGGRNGARGPNYQRLDFRAGYRFRLAGGRTLDAFLDMFNVTNEPNFAEPDTREQPERSPRFAATFLSVTATLDESPTRTAQINVRFGF